MSCSACNGTGCCECTPGILPPAIALHAIGENPTDPVYPMSNLFELTTIILTIPAVGSTTYLTVATSAVYSVGMSVYIVGAGWFYVSAIANATALEILNQAHFGNSDPATEIAVGAAIIASRPQLNNILTGSATWDPGSIADGDLEAKEVTVTGAALGDHVIAVTFSLDVADLVLDANVSAANIATCVLANNSGGAIDLAEGTVSVLVMEA